MAKRRKIIKRVYEQGREKIYFHPKPYPKPVRATAQAAAKEGSISRPKAVEPVLGRELIIDNYVLPSYYGATQVTLMVKDPFWIYAYWEIAKDSLARLQNIVPPPQRENGKIVLRMYDVTLKDFNGANANSWFDIEVGEDANNWYINLWHDDVSCLGELGLRTSDGRFFALGRSNCVHTPRMNYSRRNEQMWMEVTDEKYGLLQAESGLKVDEPKKASTMIPYVREAPAAAGKRRRAVYLSEEDIRRYYGNLSPLLRDVIASRLSRLYGKKSGAYKFILEGETEAEKLKRLSLFPRDYFKRILLGSSEELIIGGSEQRLGPGGGSEFLPEKIKEHKFFFELDAELIVYGRTEPNAEVWLKDKKIPLRNDGTFSLRFALPDGKIPLEFSAVSHDKKKIKKIITRVERRTSRSES